MERATRRAILGGAAATVGLASLAGRARAQGTAKVFLDYTQEELDRAYNQRVWAANAGEVIARYGARSIETRRKLAHKADIAYGPNAEETLDIFPAASTRAPLQVFVHGGAWESGSKNDYSFPAETFVPAGVTYVALNFANIPAARVTGMADQVRRAIAWLYRNAEEHGGDRERIFVSGHSSGGHLAAVLLTTDWSALGVPAGVIKGGVCISGIYEMEPVMLSSRSSYVRLSPEEADSLSPIRHLDRIACPIILAYGTSESPEFKRQGEAFATALKAAGRQSELHVLPNLNHFEMAESLADPETALSQLVLRQMGMGAR